MQRITGKPYKPTTQGKNERFHQTLHKYLHGQPPAPSMTALQARIDTFDHYHNTEREHQGLAPGTTPQEAWNAIPQASAPAPPEPGAAAGSDRRSIITHPGRRKEHPTSATEGPQASPPAQQERAENEPAIHGNPTPDRRRHARTVHEAMRHQLSTRS